MHHGILCLAFAAAWLARVTSLLAFVATAVLQPVTATALIPTHAASAPWRVQVAPRVQRGSRRRAATRLGGLDPGVRFHSPAMQRKHATHWANLDGRCGQVLACAGSL